MEPNHNPPPLSHLTAVHLLGRILERIDHEHHVTSSNRYECAMRRLTRSLDEIEQRLALREVLNRLSGSTGNRSSSGNSFCKLG